MDRPILYVNACVRRESRTRNLAEKLLAKLDRPFEEIRLEDTSFPAVNEEYLNLREADEIVIAAPYWDLSFPAMLKQYLEQINVVRITFKYSEDGVPIGLCRARRLFYVTTAGGFYAPEEYGFGYVKALAQNYYGIQDVRKIEALGLDIFGAEVNAIMTSAAEQLDGIMSTGDGSLC